MSAARPLPLSSRRLRSGPLFALPALAALLAVSAADARVGPSLASLPAAAPAALDLLAAPSSIPAGETAAGLTASAEGVEHRRNQATVLRFASLVAGGQRCLSAAPDGRDLKGRLDVFQRGGVMAVRSERLAVAPDGTAALEVVGAWFDTRSLGVRVASTSRLPLVELARGPGDGDAALRVYGYREGADVDILIPSAAPVAPDPTGRGPGACGHAHLKLPSDGTAATVLAVTSASPQGAPASADLVQLVVSASVSRLSRDPTPVLSIAIALGVDEPAAEPAQAQVTK